MRRTIRQEFVTFSWIRFKPKLSSMDLLQRLKAHFPYSQFRSAQRIVIEELLAGRSTLGLMPTGSGKSLCYQFFANPNEGLVIVVSPLIALIEDQRQKALQLGLRCAGITSIQAKNEREEAYRKLALQELDIIFVTPERFRNSEFRQALDKNKIRLFAVDEAHCISMWGHDFRPDYSKLGELRKSLGNPLTLALTATATPEVQKDILKSLNLVDAPVHTDGLSRPNLEIYIEDVVGFEEKMERALAHLEKYPGPAIFYFSLIETLRKATRFLEKKKSHLIFHGELPGNVRRQNLKKFMEESAPLMLATPAFGLGIDKENIRTLIHFEIPGSIEAYYQEIGRAGRDGKNSRCVLMYDEDDISIQMGFFKWANPEPAFIEKIYDLITSQRDKVDSGGFDFLREQMVFKSKKDYRIEAAVNILDRWGCLQKSDDPFPFQAVRPPSAEDFELDQPEKRLRWQNQKLLDLVRFLKNTEDCRLNQIYKYFGHDEEDSCGHCDVCTP